MGSSYWGREDEAGKGQYNQIFKVRYHWHKSFGNICIFKG